MDTVLNYRKCRLESLNGKVTGRSLVRGKGRSNFRQIRMALRYEIKLYFVNGGGALFAIIDIE